MKLDELLAITNEAVLAAGGTKEMAGKVLDDIRKAAAEEKADRKETATKTKHDFAFLALDPEGLLAKGTALQGFVFQIEKDGDPTTLLDRVKAAATEFNNTKKGRRVPVSTVPEAVENVAAKFWKSQPGRITRVKTKTPVYLSTVVNPKL
jgi:hypothetical protein